MSNVKPASSADVIVPLVFLYFLFGYGTAFVLDVMAGVVDGWEVLAAGVFWPLFWIKYLGWGIFLLFQGLFTALF